MTIFDENLSIDGTPIVRMENDFLQVDVATGVGGRIVNILEKSSGLSRSSETAYEVYYDVPILPFLNVGASLQYVKNPGGIRSVPEAVVAGFRASITF